MDVHTYRRGEFDLEWEGELREYSPILMRRGNETHVAPFFRLIAMTNGAILRMMREDGVLD